MEVWLGIVIIAVLVVTHLVAMEIGVCRGFTKGIQTAAIAYYNYQQTSQQTRQRGTPEQERGSDDTG